ncbi:putative U2 small nuclear ribonucleoprotein A' [Giardia muris]|uniref:Putative U2 small nuclear ribonucleoprotein A n=1 Tax=Giardia muris TaxID=5742 RepID=A0A4Z1T4T6_GIAMU|nr:putative U2 small nuclear ribonucleoprotein A' [Giardia muris]|eukprot:TNJ29013.1 putative U2 small nuclear ribonucleoprotein A' [Giardia muris]
MVRITPELLRKRSEHNEGVLSTLEEIALHQFKIRQIEVIDECCPRLQILLLQSNKIRRIENLKRLRELKYLNLALNRITKLENLETLESLEKLDLTANQIHNYRDFRSLSGLTRLRELFVMGNPLQQYPYWREFLIVVIPSLAALDGRAITREDRIMASDVCRNHREEIAAIAFDAKVPDWEAESDNSDYEDRDASVKIKRAAEETAKGAYDARSVPRERPSRTINPELGRVQQYNELGFKFWFDELPRTGELVCCVALPVHLPTDSVDVDVDAVSILLVSKESGRQMQLALPHEVYMERVRCVRVKATGVLKIYMKVLFPERLRQYEIRPVTETKTITVLESVVSTQYGTSKAAYEQDEEDEGSLPSDLPDLLG